jgi:hypothetical protein
MNKKQVISIAIIITIILLGVGIFVINSNKKPLTDSTSQTKPESGTSTNTTNTELSRDKQELQILPYSIFSTVDATSFSKRLVDGSRVYILSPQDVQNGGIGSEYKINGEICGFKKCFVVDVNKDAVKLDTDFTYLTSFSIKDKDYWVGVKSDKNSYFIVFSEDHFATSKDVRFDKPVKNITEVGSEKGLFEVEYNDGAKEKVDLKLKI